MKSTLQKIKVFAGDDSGQSLIEYALIAGLIGLGAVIAMTSLKNSIVNAFSSISSQLTSAL